MVKEYFKIIFESIKSYFNNNFSPFISSTEYVNLDDYKKSDAHNVINRSVIKKWGINVGEVILSIRKI